MQRIDSANFVPNLFGAGKNGYQDYNPATGQIGTELSAAALNAMQEELAGVIEWQGLPLNPADNTQLRQAIIAYVTAQIVPYETVAAATSALASAIAGLETPAEVAAAISAALTAYAPLNSPAFTGTPTVPTPGSADNSTKAVNSAWVNTFVSTQLTGYETAAAATAALASAVAGLDSPAQVATAIAAALATYAPLNSPALTGNPTAPTQTAGDNSTKIASTAYMQANTFSASQSWQGFTSGTRAFGTTYYNTTGAPIFVSAWGQNVSGGYSLTGVVNGVTVAVPTTNYQAPFINFIVPPGGSYSIAGSYWAGWAELR